MLATISPSSRHSEETLSTLRYARQARNIINKVRVNEDPKARLIRGEYVLSLNLPLFRYDCVGELCAIVIAWIQLASRAHVHVHILATELKAEIERMRQAMGSDVIDNMSSWAEVTSLRQQLAQREQEMRDLSKYFPCYIFRCLWI